jgi:hypothetical protein
MEEEKKKKHHPVRKLCWLALKITGLVLLVKWIKSKMGGKDETCVCDEERKDEII